jgi:hypothetical protein
MIDNPHFADIKLGIRLLFQPGELVEFRVSLTGGYFRGFHFTDHDRLAEVIHKLDQDSRIVSLYYVINPLKPSFISERAKCECKICSKGGLIILNPTDEQMEQIIHGPSQHLCGNDDIASLNWLFIDVDTVRAKGFEHESSTKEEKAAAREVAKRVIAYLDEIKFPQPILCDSGNGFHILPRVKMLNTDHNMNLLGDCLKALSSKFTCDAAKIDNAVFNAARLTRAYGTTTRKGTSTDDRPFRHNRLIPLSPETMIGTVSLDQILALGYGAPRDRAHSPDGMPELDPSFDPEEWIDWYERQGAFEIEGERESRGVTYRITNICLNTGHKHTGSGVTGFAVGDTFGYHCFSDDCEGVTIGSIIKKLTELGYEPYPYPIWVQESLILDFAEDVQSIDDAEEDAQPTSVSTHPGVAAAQIETESSESRATQPVKEPEAEKTSPETAQPIGGEPVAMATDLIAILLDDTSDEARGNYIMYRQRLDQIAPYLDAPVGDTMMRLVAYERALRKLPTPTELKDYVNRHPDSAETKAETKKALCEFIDGLRRDPAKTLDVTAIALLDEVNLRLEKIAFKKAFAKVRDDRDIQAGRTILRKHWATSTSLDTGFKSDPWQLRGDEIYQSFERDVMGTDDGRKFETGFPSIDNSGMNIGLDGEHAIVLYGPASNRKTTAALSMALNFSMRGKHGLYIAGEHQTMRVLKSLTLMLSHFLKKEIGEVPGLSRWEGLNRKATEADLAKIKNILTKLSMMEIVPGYLEVQNAHALTRGEKDKLGAIMSYAESTHKKYQWDYIVIDPLDSIMPPDDGPRGNNWKACSTIVDRLFDYSRSYAGDRGIMVITTAQFKVDSGRDIAKLQEKNTGEDNYDDQIEAILRKDSMIQYFTTICQRFDLGIGIATSQKNGNEGMLVQGRTRGGGNFGVVRFVVGDRTNYLREKKPTPLLVEEARIELAKDGML